MSFKHTKTPAELHEAFLRQVRHLRRSIATYDAGDREVAELIATTLYTLFRDDGSKVKSAAGLAGLKDNLQFPDTSYKPSSDPKVLRIGPPLCQIGDDGTYFHRSRRSPSMTEHDLASHFPMLPFRKWWKQVVFTTDTGIPLRRMNLVFSMRNQDGGGHVDEALKDESYHWLSAYGDIYLQSSDSHNFKIYYNPKWVGRYDSVIMSAFIHKGMNSFSVEKSAPPIGAQPIKDAHWASMRQIAWEAEAAIAVAGF